MIDEQPRNSDHMHPGERSPGPRSSRDMLYESIGVTLVNAGVMTPAARFVDDVRRAAGFRAAPRQIEAALAEMARADRPVSAEAVAEVVSGARGTFAERQHRHAEDWRALGAALSLRGMDGTPDGQRAFLGAVRRVAGPRATDVLLLSVALAIAGERRALDPELIGKVAKRLAKSASDLSPEDISTLAKTELRNLVREQRHPPGGRRTPSAPPRRTNPRTGMVQTRKPGKRAWAPGGRRRRTVRLPSGMRDADRGPRDDKR